jgi:hypothetical protein
MNSVDKAVATQLANIEKRTGKSLAQLAKLVRASGLSKHGELVAMLKRDLGMGHGDANMLVHTVRQQDAEAAGGGAPATADDALAAIYSGKKAALRPIHDRLMAGIGKFGEFELAPKKTYVSLRRRKQFATIGPATNTQVEVGLNVKGLEATDRLVALPPKGMCDYKVRLSTVKEVDGELLGWLRAAFDAAG